MAQVKGASEGGRKKKQKTRVDRVLSAGLDIVG